MHPAMTFTGTDVDLDRLAGCVFGVTAGPGERAGGRDAGRRPRRHASMWVDEEQRALYHAGLAHGANHLVTLVVQAMDMLRAAGADDPAGTLRPLLTAALDNALAYGDAALTGPIVRGDVETVRAHLAEHRASRRPHTLESYVAMARATPTVPSPTAGCCPIRAAAIRRRARRGARRRSASTPPAASGCGDRRRRTGHRSHPRASSPTCSPSRGVVRGHGRVVPTMGALHAGHAACSGLAPRAGRPGTWSCRSS